MAGVMYKTTQTCMPLVLLCSDDSELHSKMWHILNVLYPVGLCSMQEQGVPWLHAL